MQKKLNCVFVLMLVAIFAFSAFGPTALADPDPAAVSSEPVSTAVPTDTAVPTATPVPTDTPIPTVTPVPTVTPAPTDTVVPTVTPTPTVTPVPTITPTPTVTPVPTDTPIPTATPVPTDTPIPTATPVPTDTTVSTDTIASADMAAYVPLNESSFVKSGKPGAYIGNSNVTIDVSNFDSLKLAMSEEDGKLSTGLLQLTDDKYLPEGASRKNVIGGMQAQGEINTAGSGKGALTAEQVHVYIQLAEGADTNIIKPYVSKIESRDKSARLVTAWVDVLQLKELASLEGVSGIDVVHKPKVFTGSKLSQGDADLNAINARTSFGVDGTGVKVGVVSDGVDNYFAAIASKDLPDYISDGGHILRNNAGGDEGTAMLEIVHDLAPGAELYFHDCGNNEVEFCDGVEALAQAGCKVICDDIGWLEQPFFEDGYVATRLNNIINKYDITYSSASGNSGDTHYQGKYYNSGYQNFTDFSHGTDDLKNLYIQIPSGENAYIVMEWNNKWGKAGDDYDLFLTDIDGNLVNYSMSAQKGKTNPIETIDYTNNGNGGDFIIWARASNKAAIKDKKTLEIYVYLESGKMYSNNEVASDSIFGHAALPSVISCGAVDDNPNDQKDGMAYGVIEYYSSEGPVTMLSGTRKGISVCGVDGVAVSGAGKFGSFDGDANTYYFYGTSAAAPHVAALCALELNRFPMLSAAQVREAITNSAADKGAAGFDNVYGYGLADANAAVNYYHIVNFDSQGGSAVNNQLLKNYSAVKYFASSRSGFTFGGWFTDTDFSTPWNFKTNRVTADMTLYAKWTPKTPSIKVKATNYKTLMISWNAIANVQGYEVWREAAGEASNLVATVDGWTVTSYNDTNVQAHVKYYYKVRAYLTQGSTTIYGNFSAKKNAVTAWPAVKVKASRHDYQSVYISWNDLTLSTGVTGYEVYRGTRKNGAYSLIADNVTNAYYIDSSIPKAGKAYYYKVRPFEKIDNNNKIYGAKSSCASAKPNGLRQN